jgi:hypothetical protein
MTKEQAISKLKDIQKSGDQEGAHIDADDVLCRLLKELGCEDVVAEYEKISKWYA